MILHMINILNAFSMHSSVLVMINDRFFINAFHHCEEIYFSIVKFEFVTEHFQKVISEGQNFHMVIPEMAIFKR